MPSRPKESPEPTPLEIATLAARFIPPIDLTGVSPGAAWHPLEVQKIVGELTSGKGRRYTPDYRYPEGWETPFEVIAAEAVRRARLLIDAASGRQRQAVLDYIRDEEEASAQLRDRFELEQEFDSNFRQLAAGRDAIPLGEVIRFALRRMYSHNPEKAWDLLQEYLMTRVIEFRRKHELPELEVTFEEIATPEQKDRAVDSMARVGPPHCVVLKHGRSYQVGAREFPSLVLDLRGFYVANNEKIRKKKGRSSSRTEKPRRSPSKADPNALTHSDSRKLDAAARKV